MKTLEELKKIREKAQADMKLRSTGTRVKVIVGMGTSGIAMGARDVMKAFLDEIGKRNLSDVQITQTGEKGLTSMEPVVDIVIEGKSAVTYGEMTPEKVLKVIEEHIINGNVVNEFVVAVDK
ncbi:MAG: (2Fe-2S) ferredoxin domain-containing protein [Candidatus Cloacimonetes bacterium]|nr:(2Fe-2S) ferredoxin domain-containing protein [Candidatus Cloacimonadota bacterium]